MRSIVFGFLTKSLILVVNEESFEQEYAGSYVTFDQYQINKYTQSFFFLSFWYKNILNSHCHVIEFATFYLH